MQNSNTGQGQPDANDGNQSKGQAGGQQSAFQSRNDQQGQAGGASSASGKREQSQPSQVSGSGQQGSNAQASQQGDGSQRPAGGETLARAAQGAHRAVDATVEKVAPVVDAVHDKVESVKGAPQGAEDVASDVHDKLAAAKGQAGEWIGAAREVIVQNPFAAIAGAFLLGAAYVAAKRR